MRPCDFWGLHPTEFWWLAEGHKDRHEALTRHGPGLDEEEIAEMYDELKQAKAAAGAK